RTCDDGNDSSQRARSKQCGRRGSVFTARKKPSAPGETGGVDNRAMPRVAVIEDDQPTSQQLAGWIRAARPDVQVDQWFTRDEAEAALAREAYDVVVLDIELGRERHAGVALINAINKQRKG